MSASLPAPVRADAAMTTVRLIDRLALTATLVIFCLAVVVLVREFAHVSPRAVLASLAAMPVWRVLAALALTAANYLCLTGYDVLALRYVRRRLRMRDVLFASFAAFAFSNNVGFQLLSGGSIRYRLYSRFGLAPGVIGMIVVFCAIAYALGVIAVTGLLALFEPAEIATLLHLPQTIISLGGLVLLAVILVYLALAVRRQPLRFGRFHLHSPSFPLALAQVVLASVDAVLAATVMYVLLPAGFGIGYAQFLAVYLIAATASVVSLVPGGLGVFETAITLLTVPTGKAAMIGVFLALRLIYFILPLVVAMLGFLLHEWRRRPRRHRS